jgi:quercetin dioxygenase-like cupin family protein
MLERTLRLYIDRLPARAVAAALPSAPRVIYVREGDATLRSAGQAATLAANSAWHGTMACEVTAGAAGATLLRWELVARGAETTEASTGSTLALAQAVELPDASGYLMRCDRVDFPLGGIAYTHTHRGPGIRCLLTGEIRIRCGGTEQVVKPGEAWFESGPEPVLALASEREATAFARLMILPDALRGKSSIRYVNAEDADKPKTQRYQVFCDEPVTL